MISRSSTVSACNAGMRTARRSTSTPQARLYRRSPSRPNRRTSACRPKHRTWPIVFSPYFLSLSRHVADNPGSHRTARAARVSSSSPGRQIRIPHGLDALAISRATSLDREAPIASASSPILSRTV